MTHVPPSPGKRNAPNETHSGQLVTYPTISNALPIVFSFWNYTPSKHFSATFPWDYHKSTFDRGHNHTTFCIHPWRCHGTTNALPSGSELSYRTGSTLRTLFQLLLPASPPNFVSCIFSWALEAYRFLFPIPHLELSQSLLIRQYPQPYLFRQACHWPQ